jgi:arginase
MKSDIVRIIGVPMDLGQNRRGVDMGPSAVRYAGLQSRLANLSYETHDEGNIQVPNPEEHVAVGSAKRLAAVTTACEEIYKIGRQCVARGEFALYLGGDHSITIGTFAAAAKDEPVGLIWIDAHGDFNTPETSLTGNIHGMPAAVLVGQGSPSLVNLGHPGPKVLPSDVVQIGIRDLDLKERQRLSQSGINVYTMRHVDEMSIAAVARQALDHLRHLTTIHVSLDMDSLDPTEAPGVGTRVPGGLTYREAHLVMEILGDSGRISSLDVVEINPILDAGNQTAELAVELVASLLGQRIL